MEKLTRVLGLRDLILFNIVAIPGLRWIAIAAAAGFSSLGLWVFAFLLFFVPQGLMVIELSTRYPEEGGLYVWTKKAFGDFHGFLSGWCYWSNNLVYYPSLLIYIGAMSAFALGAPQLETNKLYMVLFTIAVLWIALLLNAIGMKVGRWVQNIGSFGIWIPITLLIILAAVSVAYYGQANEFSPGEVIPHLGELKTIAFFSVLCFGFAGLELAPIMGEEIKNPRKNIPRAIIISGILITLIYLVGTYALLAALPRKDISIITGVVQAIARVGERLGFAFTGNLVAILVVLSGLGAAGAWLGGTARILFVAGLDKHLPAPLAKVHPRWGTPHIAILLQGILSTVFIIMSFTGSSIKDAYMILLDMVIVIYFIPYLYMFASLIALRRKKVEATKAILIPGGKTGAWLTSLVGFGATLLAIIMATVPSEAIKNVWLYEAKVLGGCAAFLLTGTLIYLASKAKRKKP
ncbi:MAG: APC family permease [Acidobacteriota bacterium]